MRLNLLNSETVRMKGISLFFLTSKTLTPRLKLIAGESPEKAIAYNFDFIPDLESENETK